MDSETGLSDLEFLVLTVLFFLEAGGNGLYLLYAFRWKPPPRRIIPLDTGRFHRLLMLGYFIVVVNLAVLVLSVICAVYFGDPTPLVYIIFPLVIIICLLFIDIPRLWELYDEASVFAE